MLDPQQSPPKEKSRGYSARDPVIRGLLCFWSFLVPHCSLTNFNSQSNAHCSSWNISSCPSFAKKVKDSQGHIAQLLTMTEVLHTLFSLPHPLQLQLLLDTFPHWLLFRLRSDLRASSESLSSTLLHACCHSAVSAPALGFLPPCRSCICPKSGEPPQNCLAGRQDCEEQEEPGPVRLLVIKRILLPQSWKTAGASAWTPEFPNARMAQPGRYQLWKGSEEVRALENMNCCWKCHFSMSTSKPYLELLYYHVLTEKEQASCLGRQQAFILNSASACTCSWQPQGLHSGPLPARNQTWH